MEKIIMKNIIQYFITGATAIILIGGQADAETSTTTSNSQGSSQWTCGVNAVCGNISGLSSSIDLEVAPFPAFNGSYNNIVYGSRLTNGHFVIPVLNATNGSQYDVINGFYSIGNNGSVCKVTGNPYIMGGSNNIQVQCGEIGYSIGGTVSGLNSGDVLTINNASSDQLAKSAGGFVTQNGPFTLPNPVPGNALYKFSAEANEGYFPNPTRTCKITNGSGTINNANVTNIQIQC
jgi:hypothetical protein